MSNIRYLEGQSDLFWNKVKNEFAGFDKPRIFSAQAIRKDAPQYLLRYLDEDPSSFYMFLAGDPLKHQDISRDKACEFFERFFYEHMRMPSSFDVNAGGEYSRKQAIDKEVLPARDDSAYRTFAQEQEDLARQWAEQQERDREQDENRWEQEHGFRRDDPDIIDVTDDSSTNTSTGSSSREISQATGTAVGMPRKIFYAVDFHIPADGNMLGYDRGDRLSGRGNYRRLREDEKKNDPIAEIKKIMKDLDKSSGLWIALDKVCDKFGTSVDEEMKKILDECDTNEDEEDQVKAAEQEETPAEKPEEPAEQTDECDKCGDDDCKAGEKCGLKEADIKVVPDDEYGVETEYNSSLPPEKRKIIVRQSEAGSPDDDDPLDESFDIGQVSIWRELITERS